MIIDQNARNRLLEERKTRSLIEGIQKAIQQPPQEGTPPEQLTVSLYMLQALEALQESVDKLAEKPMLNKDVGAPVVNVDTQSIVNGLKKLENKIQTTSNDDIIVALKELKTSVENIPQPGVVEFPPVQVNLGEISQGISDTIGRLESSLTSAIAKNKVTVPNTMKVGNTVKIQDFSDLLDGIEELKKGFNLLINKEVATVAFPSTTVPVEIQNWKIPQPVTNVSINPNRGTMLSTAVTVTSTATPLPATALADRRSMVIYNNGSATVYVGGSNVTSSNGIPVASGSYGPAIDAGPLNIVYGITASSTADVRVLEMNDTTSGGDS